MLFVFQFFYFIQATVKELISSAPLSTQFKLLSFYSVLYYCYSWQLPYAIKNKKKQKKEKI